MDYKALYEALERADAAGDTAAATEIAAYIRTVSAGAVPAPIAPPPKKAGFSLKDIGASFLQGVVGAGKSLTDVAGAGNVASEGLESVQKSLTGSMTPERQAELQRRQKLIEAARDKGTWEEIKAELGGIAEAPLPSTAQALGSIVPYAITGIAGGVLKLLPQTVKAINLAVGAAQGAGAVKGSIYDDVKARLIAGGMNPAKAEEQAKAAQEYTGKNLDQILAGAGFGAAAAGTGVEKLLLKGAGEKAPAKLLPRVGKAMLGEAPMEGAQGGQEQLAQNIAAQREGFNVPTMRGVAGSAARDATLGALAAGTVGAVRGPKAKEAPPPPDQPPMSEVADERTAPLTYTAPAPAESAEPTPPREGAFTAQDIADTGVAVSRKASKWVTENVLNKTADEVMELVVADPTLVEGKSQRAKLLRALLTPEVKPYEGQEGQQAGQAVPQAAQEGTQAGPVAGTPADAGPGATAEGVRTETVEPATGATAGAPVQPDTQPTDGVPPSTTSGSGTDAADAARPAGGTDAQPDSLEEQPPQEAKVLPTLDEQHEALLQRLQDVLDDATATKAQKAKAMQVLDTLEGEGPDEATAQMNREAMENDAGRREVYAWGNDVLNKIARGADRFSVGEKSNAPALGDSVVARLRANDLVGALHHLSQTSANEVTRAVAERVKALLGQTHVRLTDKLADSAGNAARGAASADGSQIWLHTANGMDEETLLHEATHAATEHVLQQPPEKLTQVQRTALVELNRLWAAAKADKSIPLTKEARNNLSEFVTEGMTNPAVQAAMRAKPWKTETAWDAFKSIVLRLLNIVSPQNMRDAHLAAVDAIMAQPDLTAERDSRALYALSPAAQSLVTPTTPIPQGMLATAQAGLKASGLPFSDVLRTQVSDIAAGIERRINARGGFDGAVRNALGQLNPMLLYRQAQDYQKMLLVFMEKGAIEKDPSTGLWEVKDAKGEEPAQIFKMIEDWGKKQGMSFPEAKDAASRILEGMRLAELRDSNRTKGTTFVIHKIKRDDPRSADQQINTMVAEYAQHPELAQIQALMDKARVKLIDHMVSVGRLSKQMGADWKSVANYVPFDRIEDVATRLSGRVKKIGSRTPLGVSALPSLVGSHEFAVGNVFDNYIGTLGWMVGQVMNTDARNTTLNYLQSIQSATFLGNSKQGRPNATNGFKDGEEVYWELPSKYDALAFKDLAAPQASWVRTLGVFSNALRTSITALPPFALKQVTDDIQRALLTSGVRNPLALTWRVLKNFPKIAFAEVFHKGHPEMEGLGRYGVTGGFDFINNKPAETLLADLGYQPRGWFREALHRLEGITRASDFAVRKAIYDQSLVEGQSKAVALARAREFINFRRRGANDGIGVLVTTIPFFNAYIQGMDVLLRAATGDAASASVSKAQARGMFWSRAAIVSSMAAMYALAKSDDDEYKEADLRVRHGNWMFGNGIKLPVPGELAALFKVIPETIVEYYQREGTPEEQTAMEAIRTAALYAFEQYAGRVTPIPQAIKPLLEVFTNHSFLTGRELEGIHHKTLDPHARTTSATSEAAIAIAKFAADEVGVEVSPITIDTVLRGYFGSTAAMTTMAVDQIINPDRMDRPMSKWFLLSNYVMDDVGTRRVTEFYDAREPVVQHMNTYNKLAESDPDRALEYFARHRERIMLYSAVNDTLEELENTRKFKTYLNGPQAAKEMSQEERADALEQTRRTEVQLVGWLREAKTTTRATEYATP